MSIAKMRLDESTKLEFGVAITGASGTPQTRLVIEGRDFSISYPCKPTTEGVEVQINELKHILPAGTYPIKLEIIVENKIYVPFADTITFEPAVEVTPTPRVKVVEEKESIKINNVVVKESTPSQDRMKVAAVIAEMVGYFPKLDETPQSIVDNALKHSSSLTESSKRSFEGVLKLAEEVGIHINRTKKKTTSGE